MQCQHSLLLPVFYSGRLYRLLNRAPDGLCIGCIILVADIEGLDEFDRHQFHRMAESAQLPSPVMGATTGFHANKAGLTIGKKLNKLRALDRLTKNFSRIHIHEVNLHRVPAMSTPTGMNFIFVSSCIVKNGCFPDRIGGA
ncbi:TPA: hypothetical protein MFG61_005234 [Klebsiella pneumoniae]|nr:hypothetical protein [Escherichia coli]EIV7933814.1 hypothetical protein [Klebsiella pneumoniae]QMC33022.1 hypothetical protein HVZ82_26115 [Klebsiella pneumoniae]HBW3482252.1 hypothetical protein [Klebsiella pneumoniae]HBW7895301.1 hypothetical protein [Klebsiella pneumoniae]